MKFLAIFLIPIFLFALEGKVISIMDEESIKNQNLIKGDKK